MKHLPDLCCTSHHVLVHPTSLSNSSTVTAGTVLNEMPSILLISTDVFIARPLSCRSTMIARSVSPRRAYAAWSSPPFRLIKAVALSLRSALMAFSASNEYLPSIRYVAMRPSILDEPEVERLRHLCRAL